MEQRKLESIFKAWEETLIWSCLEGVMGEIYANANEDAVMALLGDFAFFAGKPCEELVCLKPKSTKQDFIIMVPQSEEWSELMEKCYGERAKRVTRYAIKRKRIYLILKSLSRQFHHYLMSMKSYF